MTDIQIALLIIGIVVLVGSVIGFTVLYFADKRRTPVVRSYEVYNGAKLVSTTYNTYIGKDLVKSETITY